MDKITWLSTLTYLLLIASLLFSYYASKGRYLFACIFIGVGAVSLLTWALIDHKLMNYQDANIGLGLIFILIWSITIIVFLFSVSTLIQSRKK